GHDQATGLSDVKCIEDSQRNIGHHEQQISTLGEADLVRHLANCEKNPGHTNFIPIQTFSIKHLPQAHQNTDMYAFIKAASNLTSQKENRGNFQMFAEEGSKVEVVPIDTSDKWASSINVKKGLSIPHYTHYALRSRSQDIQSSSNCSGEKATLLALQSGPALV
ncbi:hypothetical protein BgiBS90_032342, partial [Biomphalaria glabrata]